MHVTAKFKVDSVLNTTNGAFVTLFPVTGGSEENEKFYKYTPSGKIELGTINEVAAKQFTPGKEVFVHFADTNE